MEPERPRPDTMSVLSLVLGIASIPLIFCYVLGLPAGVAAIVLGVLALRRTREQPNAARWQPLVGIVCGAIAVIAMIVVIALPD